MTRRPAARRVATSCVALTLLVPALLLPVLGATPVTASEPPATTGPVDLGGTAVRASTDTRSPTLLTAGLWSDVLGPSGTADGTHQFAYRRVIADSTVHLAVSASPADPGGDGIELVVQTPDGEPCDSANDTTDSPVTTGLLGAGVTIGLDDPTDRDEACVLAPELHFSVSRYTFDSAEDLAVAVRVVEEAPVVGDPAELPQPPEETAVLDLPDPADPEEGEELTGSDAFASAPELEPGTTYTGVVPQGGAVLYRVPLQWGQSLRVRADVPVKDQEALTALETSEPTVRLTLLDPFRAVVGGEVDEDEPTTSYDDEEVGLLGDGTAPVAYLNRFADVATSVPGDHWVSFAAQPAAEGQEPVDVPLEITVEVDGEPGPAPIYPATVTGPGGSPGPEGYDAATPYLVGDGVFAAEVSGEPSAAAEPARRLVRQVGGLALAAVSVLSLVVGVRRLVRHRRMSAA